VSILILKAGRMRVWEGAAKGSLKVHQGPPYPTLLHLAGGYP
jgi:hypothetical protein